MAPLSAIEHIVVLMLENRSFDNVFGWLYDPGNSPPFDKVPSNFEGVSGKNLSNHGPKGNVPANKGTVPTDPYPDPGEPYEDVYEQLYDVPRVSLDKTPPPPATPPGMKGFVHNYARINATNPEIIMNGFTPATLPVLSSLAHYYGVCDHWFCSIPSQTICNRSFVHAGTSSGYVDNKGGDGILFVNKAPTIFNVLPANRSWRVYTASWTITSLVLLTQEKVWDHALDEGHFRMLHDFENDAKTPGGLPSYSYIEPNYMDSLVWGPENDMHPESHVAELYGISNVEEGEKLVYRVYSAIRNSPDWDKTMLVILFDEHGGCFDHEPPPSTVSPDGIVIPQSQPGGSGFQFDHLGVRIPAIVISPFTAPQTILNDVFDHTSVLKTIMECFGLPTDQLGSRAKVANFLNESNVLTLDSPRTDLPPIPEPADMKVSFLQRTEALGRLLEHGSQKPMSELHKSSLIRMSQRLGRSDLELKARSANTVFDGDSVAIKLEAELWKQRRARRNRQP